jgi:cold-inducible RNA-binding protein
VKNIFVGNLDITTTEGQLRELFASHGTVATVTVVMDRDAGTPRGFAFVEMSDNTEAEAAIKALNGAVLNDRPMAVNEARPKEDQDRSVPTERRKQAREPLATRTHRRHRY